MNKMPIHPNDLKKTKLTSVPFALMKPDMARSNHGQTLERLAERGGMGVLEILDNIHERGLQFREATAEEVKELEKLVDDFSKPTMNKLQQAARADKFYQRNVLNPYPSQSQSHTAYKKGFEEGYDVGYGSAAGEFAEWAARNRYFYEPSINAWCRSIFNKHHTTAELLTLWKQTSL